MSAAITTNETFGQFLDHLHRGGAVAHWWRFENKVSIWFDVNNRDGKPYPSAWDNSGNVYFSVHPCTQIPDNGNEEKEPRFRKSRLEYIAAVNCFFAEFDPKHYGDKEAIKEHLWSLTLYPSVIIDSGGGLHCYWLLTPTVMIDDNNREYIKTLQYAWVDLVGGDDDSKDLARVLRPVGTQNRKPKYAPNFPTVSFIECDLERLYRLEEFERLTYDIRGRSQKSKPDQRLATTTTDDLITAATCLKRLSPSRADDYGDWLTVGMTLHSLGSAGLQLWDEWSQQSAEYEPGCCDKKWDSFTDGKGVTLGTLVHMANEDDPTVKVQRNQAPVTEQAPITATGAATTGGQPTSSTAVILQTLEAAGYSFRMNELDDSIEVNEEIISDGVASEIRCTMRDKGFRGMEAVKDAYTMNAYHNRYHPIRDFLGRLTWDGDDHIMRLAKHFTSTDAPIVYKSGGQRAVFHAFLQRWLVGAVAKVFERGQNITLTLAGPQGIGKSYVASWLCSPMREYFNEGQLDPDGKETDRRLARTWIWEIGELGATTRRADVSALKNKLTQQDVTFRVPYGHYDVTKPVLTSFIGTVNPDGRGFLVDRTGNRRFATANIATIDHSYSASMNACQVWAQAVTLYRAGEPWRLTAEETTTQNEINAEHQAEETLDMLMYEIFHFSGDDNDKMEPFRVAQELLFKNYAKDLDKCAKDAAAWLKANGHIKRGKPPTWRGIRLRLPHDAAQNGRE
jgi:hypothetical protein